MKKPWEIQNCLKEEHLQIVARLIRQTRLSCREHRFNEEMGDSKLSYGVTAREWIRQAFRSLIASKKYDFLGIIEDSGQRFVFEINKVPVKFYSGDYGNPDKKIYNIFDTEVAIQQNLFGDDPNAVFWRFVVDTTTDEEGIRMGFLGVDTSDNIISMYIVPLENNVKTIYEVNTADVKEPVKQEKPVLRRKDSKIAESI